MRPVVRINALVPPWFRRGVNFLRGRVLCLDALGLGQMVLSTNYYLLINSESPYDHKH